MAASLSGWLRKLRSPMTLICSATSGATPISLSVSQLARTFCSTYLELVTTERTYRESTLLSPTSCKMAASISLSRSTELMRISQMAGKCLSTSRAKSLATLFSFLAPSPRSPTKALENSSLRRILRTPLLAKTMVASLEALASLPFSISSCTVSRTVMATTTL